MGSRFGPRDRRFQGIYAPCDFLRKCFRRSRCVSLPHYRFLTWSILANRYSLALVVMVASMLYLLSREPPPTPATQWVIDTGSKFGDRQDLNPPDDPTKFSYSPEELSSSETEVKEIKMAFKNEHDHDVKVRSLQVQFSSGKNDSALFYDGIQFRRSDGSKEKGCFSFASRWMESPT
jgi:hypothetical protein